MMDFIRSPLQFIRPMTDQEWQELRLRAEHREIRRKRRQRAKQKLLPTAVVKRHLESLRATQPVDSSGVF